LPRKFATAAVSAVLLLVAYGCGSSGPDVSTGTRQSQHHTTTADGATDASGLQTVSYQGVQFQVPAGWPVYNLDTDPSTCVRFDQHAVYLGHSSANMQCPVGIVGRTEAVQVQPPDASTSANSAGNTAGGVSAQDVNGLSAQVVSGGEVTNQLSATFPTVGLVATISYADDGAGAQQILQSFRAVAQ